MIGRAVTGALLGGGAAAVMNADKPEKKQSSVLVGGTIGASLGAASTLVGTAASKAKNTDPTAQRVIESVVGAPEKRAAAQQALKPSSVSRRAASIAASLMLTLSAATGVASHLGNETAGKMTNHVSNIAASTMQDMRELSSGAMHNAKAMLPESAEAVASKSYAPVTPADTRPTYTGGKSHNQGSYELLLDKDDRTVASSAFLPKNIAEQQKQKVDRSAFQWKKGYNGITADDMQGAASTVTGPDGVKVPSTTGLDRAHLIANSDSTAFNNLTVGQAQAKTFNNSNQVPFSSIMNQGVMRHVEEAQRKAASDSASGVSKVVMPVYGKTGPRYGFNGNKHLELPESIATCIVDSSAGKYSCVNLPNSAAGKASYMNASEVKSKTGVSFLPPSIADNARMDLGIRPEYMQR